MGQEVGVSLTEKVRYAKPEQVTEDLLRKTEDRPHKIQKCFLFVT